MLGVIVFSPVAYVCMNLGHWFTACMGLLGYVVTIIIACFIPETIKENKHAGEDLHDVVTNNEGLGIKKSVVNAIVSTGQSLRLVFLSDRKLGLLVLSALFADFGKSLFNLMMQYARKRLDLEWREVGACNDLFRYILHHRRPIANYLNRQTCSSLQAPYRGLSSA